MHSPLVYIGTGFPFQQPPDSLRGHPRIPVEDECHSSSHVWTRHRSATHRHESADIQIASTNNVLSRCHNMDTSPIVGSRGSCSGCEPIHIFNTGVSVPLRVVVSSHVNMTPRRTGTVVTGVTTEVPTRRNHNDTCCHQATHCLVSCLHHRTCQ